MKTKIKSYGDEATYFRVKEIPKVGCNYTCLAVINLESALKKGESYYLPVFLKECKYVENKKVIRHATDNLKSFGSDEE